MSSEMKIVGGIIVVTLAVFLGGIFFLSKLPSSPTSSTPVDQALLVRSDSHLDGNPTAKVTVVEFGDYQCPSCAVFNSVSGQILKDYHDQIRFVYRNYPLPQHQNALIAAEAAEAAGAQGKFWSMQNLLYTKQGEWSDSSKPLDQFSQYASQLGLNLARFQNEVNQNKYSDFITKDRNDGNSLDINATPTVFVNGLKIDNPTYENLKVAIESDLK